MSVVSVHHSTGEKGSEFPQAPSETLESVISRIIDAYRKKRRRWILATIAVPDYRAPVQRYFGKTYLLLWPRQLSFALYRHRPVAKTSHNNQIQTVNSELNPPITKRGKIGEKRYPIRKTEILSHKGSAQRGGAKEHKRRLVSRKK